MVRKNHALRHAHPHEPLVENHVLAQSRAQGQNRARDQNHARIRHQNPDLNPDHAHGHDLDLDRIHDHVRYPGHDPDPVVFVRRILLDLDQNHRRDRVREVLPSHCRGLGHLHDPSQDRDPDQDQDLLLVVVAVQPAVQVKVVRRVIKWNRNMFDDLNVSFDDD